MISDHCCVNRAGKKDTDFTCWFLLNWKMHWGLSSVPANGICQVVETIWTLIIFPVTAGLLLSRKQQKMSVWSPKAPMPYTCAEHWFWRVHCCSVQHSCMWRTARPWWTWIFIHRRTGVGLSSRFFPLSRRYQHGLNCSVIQLADKSALKPIFYQKLAPHTHNACGGKSAALEVAK